jgi:hypothetical protein
MEILNQIDTIAVDDDCQRNWVISNYKLTMFGKVSFYHTPQRVVDKINSDAPFELSDENGTKEDLIRLADGTTLVISDEDVFVTKHLNLDDAFEANEDCQHENNETIEVTGTEETVSICHDCGELL